MYGVRWLQFLLLSACALEGGIGFGAQQPGSLSLPERSAHANNLVCGPRAVRFVLSQYGVSVELAALVRETQWPDMAKGATLDAMKASLDKRGVRTLGLQVSPGAVSDWPYPIIVHVNKPDSEIGHYVVVFPGDSRTSRKVWDGLGEGDGETGGQLLSRMSGAILLTSPEAIPTDGIRLNGGPCGFDLYALLLLLEAIGGVAAWMFLSRRVVRLNSVWLSLGTR